MNIYIRFNKRMVIEGKKQKVNKGLAFTNKLFTPPTTFNTIFVFISFGKPGLIGQKVDS